VNREKIITELYQHPELIKIAKRLKTPGTLDWRDLLTSAIVKLLELTDDQFYAIKNYRGFVYGIMRHHCYNPYEQFNKHNAFTGEEIVDDITGQFETTETEVPQYTYDQFAKYCLKKSEADKSEDVKLAAKVTYGYLIYEPTDKGKKSYRSFQMETGIHYSSTCQYVKKMKELYIIENNENNLPSI
tara:strand:- start:1551 stop:2108 length:558 start_codon:yes stop_codon:yes gene_type:complete